MLLMYTHLQPFWPQGTGCARGFLSAMDTAWLIRGVGQKIPVMDLLCEREIIFQLLPQTTPQKLQKNIEAFTIDPRVCTSLSTYILDYTYATCSLEKVFFSLVSSLKDIV